MLPHPTLYSVFSAWTLCLCFSLCQECFFLLCLHVPSLPPSWRLGNCVCNRHSSTAKGRQHFHSSLHTASPWNLTMGASCFLIFHIRNCGPRRLCPGACSLPPAVLPATPKFDSVLAQYARNPGFYSQHCINQVWQCMPLISVLARYRLEHRRL